MLRLLALHCDQVHALVYVCTQPIIDIITITILSLLLFFTLFGSSSPPSSHHAPLSFFSSVRMENIIPCRSSTKNQHTRAYDL